MKVLGIAILLVIGLFFNNIHVSAQTVTLTPRYIQKIHLQNPERALHLLDSVEQNHLPGIQPYETDMLRSMCYEVLGEYVLKENMPVVLWLPTRCNRCLPGKSVCWWL